LQYALERSIELKMRAGSFSLPVPTDRRRPSLWSGEGATEGLQNEHTPLIPEAPSAVQEDVIEIDETDTKARIKVILHEFWILFRGSVPVILAYTLQNSLQTASVLIVGRISPEALATAAFSYMFAMATGWLIALGGSTAIDTIASATFTGSKNPHDLGIILQRAVCVLTLFYIPVVILWVCAEPLFLVLGQEDFIARDGAKFLTVLAPGGLGYILFECMKKFLQAQGTCSTALAMVYSQTNQRL